MPPSRPVFVTAYFSIYNPNPDLPEDGFKQFSWRLNHFRQLLKTGIRIVLFTDDAQPFTELLQEYRETFRLGQVLLYTDTDFYRAFHDKIQRLPDTLNAEKDTAEFMWVIMAKTEFLEKAIHMDAFCDQSSTYAWIDFSLSYVFKTPEITLSFLQTLGNTELELDTVYIPGCWGEKQTYDFHQRILWRFCGGLLLGDKTNLLKMNRLAKQHMPEFLHTFQGTLTWEVNYWAWLEHRDYFHPTWCYSDHDDWMILGIPTRAYIGHIQPRVQQGVLCPALTAEAPCRLVSNDPVLFHGGDRWTPSSASFYKDATGQAWLLIRYVNYRLDDHGCYLFPHGADNRVIHNESVLQKWALNGEGLYEPVPGSFRLASGPESGPPIHTNSMSIGLEDVRLWTDSEGNTCYIGTNVDKTVHNTPQMATGSFQLETATFSPMTIHQTDSMQKNWIPWSDDEVVYQWRLDGILFRRFNTGEARLVPYPKPNAVLSRARGSSIFIPGWNAGERVAVVHYSEEGYPRKYYHLLVVLREETGELLRYTMPFYLGETGEGGHQVNFCIGFDWTSVPLTGERLFHFWFSVMDRDPQYWVVAENSGGFQWCGINKE